MRGDEAGEEGVGQVPCSGCGIGTLCQLCCTQGLDTGGHRRQQLGRSASQENCSCAWKRAHKVSAESCFPVMAVIPVHTPSDTSFSALPLVATGLPLPCHELPSIL